MSSATLIDNVNLRSLCLEYAQKHARAKAASASPEQVILAALEAAHSGDKATLGSQVFSKLRILGKRARGKEAGEEDAASKENSSGQQEGAGARKASRAPADATPGETAESTGCAIA